MCGRNKFSLLSEPLNAIYFLAAIKGILPWVHLQEKKKTDQNLSLHGKHYHDSSN